MKAVYKIGLSLVLAGFSFSFSPAQSRVIVDARLQLPVPPFVVISPSLPPPPPAFHGDVRMPTARYWRNRGHVHMSPRYVHRHAYRKWKKAVCHSTDNRHSHHKKNHHKRSDRH